MAKLPFEGIRVADFGWVITAPLATMWLSTLGAEVIKVESKTRPEVMRSGLGGNVVPGPEPAWNRAGPYNSLNYSKYSCSLDLTRPEAQEIAHRLVEVSDVVVEAFQLPVVERFGLTYSELSSIKPDLVYLAVSSLGKTGPLKDVAGFGPSNQAFASLPSMMGYENGRPMVMGGTWPDYVVGIAAAYLTMCGLYHRRRTGQGIYMDLSMAETVMNMIPGQLLDYAMNGRVAQPQGNRDEMAVPNNTYRCQGHDKWVAISVQDEKQWAAFCHATGNPQWQRDGRFADAYGRHQHEKELDALVTLWTRERTTAEAMELLQAVGVPAGPSQDSLELINDPQLGYRGQFIEIEGHPEVGRRLQMAMQGVFSGIPERRYLPAPVYDQHNDKVFHDILGLPHDEINRLIEMLVIN